MALVVADRVRETTTTTGTGTVNLLGAVTNFEAFTSNLSNSDTTYYSIVDNTNGAFEVGLGTFTSSGTTLARTTVIASSNSNNAVDFGVGTKDVFITIPASKMIVKDASGNVTVNGDVTVSDGTNDFDVASHDATNGLKLGGTLVTSSAAELNILDGKSFVDEDNMSSNSATGIPSQQSVKAYVDSQVTAQDLDVTSDSGTIDIDLDSETLTIAGGTGLSSSASSTTVTVAVDAAQTGITSLLAENIKIGEDDQTKIDFETANEIHFYGNNVSLISLTNANSGDAVLTVPTADKNFTIAGTDGSSGITALDIDMALAGKATFSGDVVVTGDLTVTGDDIVMGTNTSGHIMVADGTNFNPVAVSGDVTIAANGAVTIAGTSVETSMIASDAITGAKIADDAINSEHYTDGSIDTAHIADLQVTTGKIAADAITEAKIADNAVENEHLNDNVISGQTALTSGLASTDELLVSDAGVIKKMDVSVLTAVTDDSATALAIALG